MLAYDKEGWGMAETRAGGPVIALVGNPNVGKSTVFNALTGLKQHTGNWPGKTVSTARGEYTYHGRRYTLVDLPGTYSLTPGSADEEVTRDYLLSGQADVTLVVADATCLARNLALVLQVLETCWPVVVCVNLLDEAAKKHIQVDLTGQVCSESIGSRQYSGTGGASDFAYGAFHSKGGRGIIALASTAKGGTISKIQPTLSPGSVVSISRNLVDYVVTEYGIAKLKNRTVRQRVENLIAVAHPDFRAELRKQADALMLW